jgi:hypothetical protein
MAILRTQKAINVMPVVCAGEFLKPLAETVRMLADLSILRGTEP